MSTATDLQTHEAVCAERYTTIQHRLDGLETKVDDLTNKIDTVKTDLYKLLIGSVVSIVTVLIGGVITILTKMA